MPYRQFFDIFDEVVIGNFEHEIMRNSDTFRDYLRLMVHKRREEMKNPNFVSKGDFLT